jgi:hypothetical protein
LIVLTAQVYVEAHGTKVGDVTVSVDVLARIRRGAVQTPHEAGEGRAIGNPRSQVKQSRTIQNEVQRHNGWLRLRHFECGPQNVATLPAHLFRYLKPALLQLFREDAKNGRRKESREHGTACRRKFRS